MLFMFIPTFCPDDCPLVVLKSEGCWGQLNHQNMRAELEDWWERYCWRGKFQKTSQGARHVWWGGRTSPYAGLRQGLKESYRCPVITYDHIWWHYCNKYSRKSPFLQSEMASSVFFPPQKTPFFGAPPVLETYRGKGWYWAAKKIQLVNLKCIQMHWNASFMKFNIIQSLLVEIPVYVHPTLKLRKQHVRPDGVLLCRHLMLIGTGRIGKIPTRGGVAQMQAIVI